MKFKLILPLVVCTVFVSGNPLWAAAPRFTPPASPRVTYNFNPGWKFIRQDVPGADNPAFDDSAWTNVSLPHTWNDVDTYRALISHGGGDQTFYQGIGWYRKHFKLPAGSRGPEDFPRIRGAEAGGAFLPQRPARRPV